MAWKDNIERECLDTGAYDEAFLGNWMRRTNWTSTFSGVNRLLLVRLAEAPSASGSPLKYGDTFIDLGLDDWPMSIDYDDPLKAPSKAIEHARGILRNDGVPDTGSTVPDKMADMTGKLSFSMCCEEFIDGQSSTTMLIYFCGVLGISPDGSTFDRPRNYTPKLSAMIHSARLICLEAVLP